MASPNPNGAKATSLAERIKNGLRYALTGEQPDGWFGPGQQLPPVAPEEVAGRQYDYPFAYNVSPRPRSETGENSITFDTLRRLADPTLGGFDLLRLVIETRKDQMAAQKWDIQPREHILKAAKKKAAAKIQADAKAKAKAKPNPFGKPQEPSEDEPEAEPVAAKRFKPAAPPVESEGEDGGEAPQDPEALDPEEQDPNAEPQEQTSELDAWDAKAQKIRDRLRRPDGHNTFRSWQRMLIEDLLVIDAPTLYIRPTGGDALVEVIDGATIKPLLAADGRPPLEGPTYSQNLKGLPAVEYTAQELLYLPRNRRSNRVYGMSPVEQIVSTINIALRRQLSQLEYYTAGSVPDMILGVPETWTPDQIKSFQSWWDAMLSGDTAERRRAKFVPGGTVPYPTKEAQIKDEWDEWLAKLVCFAFSISPQALAQQMNRATAETAKEDAAETGLEPVKLWWKDVMDDVLSTAFSEPDLEFVYRDEEIVDARTKAEVWAIATAGQAWALPSEAREDYGMPPQPQLDEAALAPPPPPMMPFGGGKPFGGKPGEKQDEKAPPQAGKEGAEADQGAEQFAAKVASALLRHPKASAPATKRAKDRSR